MSNFVALRCSSCTCSFVSALLCSNTCSVDFVPDEKLNGVLIAGGKERKLELFPLLGDFLTSCGASSGSANVLVSVLVYDSGASSGNGEISFSESESSVTCLTNSAIDRYAYLTYMISIMN